MSAEIREALASAASNVQDVQCYPYFRQATRPGDGMVRLDRMVRDSSGFAFMATWQVVIVLPQDYMAAEKWLDEHVGELVEAIGQELVVTEITQQLQLDSGTIPVVFITGNRAT